ncbi:hypothetical protein B0A49_03034 [Cryomyces minteri]|uniref:Nucleoporin Nup120/160 n=1 Tax=Cryomyces minteri TaxID=331657 RepID=A0A4U0X9V0_9PEZI|nr:hypothetical protein B0A49_03034 [Cryomyces minteri]
MANLPLSYLHRETRLNVEPTNPSSTITISLPAHSASILSSRTSSKRSLVTPNDTDGDEVAFSKRHLASEGSIYFRCKTRSPRCFLWRVLDDRKLLELQSVDVTQEEHNVHEATLTLALSFPTAIRQSGIAFADPEEHDALDVFVLTTANELYTITLHKDSFVRAVATENVADWCKVFSPSSFTFRYPYRLVAISSLQLLISLHDGGLLRLERKPEDHGIHWRETFFKDGGWSSSLRGLIPWKGQPTIRHNNVDLDVTTAMSIGTSPDGGHVFTVCLDHTLRAWNTNTGKIGVVTDLLGENPKDPRHAPQHTISPSQAPLMQIVEVMGAQDGDLYYVVTYSPKDHQFKFWGVRDADSSTHGIRDVQARSKLIPSVDELMNTTVWTLEEFHLKAGRGWRESELWIRARSGPNCKVYSLTFDLYNRSGELADVWKHDWTGVDAGPLTVDALKANLQNPGDSDPQSFGLQATSTTEQWLTFLFYPGRFTLATLETSLHVYRRGLGLTASNLNGTSFSDSTPLKQRICAAVAAYTTLERKSGGLIDYERHQMDIGAQWHMFYGLVRDLHKQRGEILSLAYDTFEGMPWLVLADYVSPIRSCSEVELLCANREMFATSSDALLPPVQKVLQDAKSESVGTLLRIASKFRAGFSSTFTRTLDMVVTTEVLRRDSETSATGALQSIYDRCDFSSQVSDEDFDRLTESAQALDGLGSVDNDLFTATLARLGEVQRGHISRVELTRYGSKTMIRGAQETLELDRKLLLDLLVLVVFMAVELEPAEPSKRFNASSIYQLLLEALGENCVLSWLTSTQRQESHKRKHQAETSGGQLAKLESPGTEDEPWSPTITLMESIFIGDWKSLLSPHVALPSLITYWCRAWTFGSRLREQYDGLVSHMMGNLLKHENYDLAMDFLRFLPSTSWPTYLKAPLYLARGEYTLAATYFKQAANGLATGRHMDMESIDTSNLLNPSERANFNDGLSRYYQHILSVFDGLKAHSYVADFAKLALHALESGAEEVNDHSFADLDRRKSAVHGSPAAVDMALAEIRMLRQQEQKTDILSRLFNASIQNSRFEEAYEALTRYTNPILRKAALTTLLTAIVQASQTALLLSLPFTDLATDVDAILLSLCARTLNIASGPPYHKLLYAWRVQRGDFRGAAEALWDRLQRLRDSSAAAHDPGEETVARAYLALINCLASVAPDQAWILVEGALEPARGAGGGAGKGKAKLGAGGPMRKKRRVVTLEDVRREYQEELDRVAALEHGRFPFGGADEMDVL